MKILKSSKEPQNLAVTKGLAGYKRAFCGLFMAIMAMVGVSTLPAFAQADSAAAVKVGPSGLPLPRFVSLKSGRVNLRVGPGTNYAVEWMYLKSGLPVEIIQEFDNWRRIRDADGSEGWINQALLSGKRMMIVAPWLQGKGTSIPMFNDKDKNSRLIAQVEPGALGEVTECNGQWCKARFNERDGWMEQTIIWGVYPDETFKD